MAKYKNIPVSYSTKYTGTRKRLGQWIKPRKIKVTISKEQARKYGRNVAISKQVKKRVGRKDYAWWQRRR